MSATSAAAHSYSRWLGDHRFFSRVNPKIRRFSKRRIWLQKANCTNNPPKGVKKIKEARAHTVKVYLQGTIFVIVFVAIRLTTTSAFLLMKNRPTRQKPKNRVRHVPSKFRFKKENGGIPKWVVARRFDNGKPSPTTFSGITTSNV